MTSEPRARTPRSACTGRMPCTPTSAPPRPGRPSGSPPRRSRSVPGSWRRSPRSTCRPGPAALIDYYRRLDAVAGDARIYVYLFAARTGLTVTPDQLAELATIPSVAGAKISGEPTSVVLQYVQAVPDDFEVYSGNDVEFGDIRPRRRYRCGVRGLQRLPATVPRARRRAAPRRRPGGRRGAGPDQTGRRRHRRGRHRAAQGRACHCRACRRARPGWRSTNRRPRSWKRCAPPSET